MEKQGMKLALSDSEAAGFQADDMYATAPLLGV
jgi:hypothetical protein